MKIDNATTQYRIVKLGQEIDRIKGDYAEPLEKARRLYAETLSLKLLELVEQASFDCADLDEILAVAIEALPNSTDSDPTRAVLKGTQALHAKLSDKLWTLIGLVVLQVAGDAASGQTKADREPAVEEEAR